MRLSDDDFRVLLAAMRDSLDPISLSTLLADRIPGFRLDLIVSSLHPLTKQVQDVARYYQLRNEVEIIVAALRDALPRVPDYIALADRLGFTTLPPSSRLEVLTRDTDTPYQDVQGFRQSLWSCENAVCRVETADSYGTGALVSPDLVLTNHHVIANHLQADGRLTNGVHCRFDYKVAQGQQVHPGTVVEVKRVAASSPHAAIDLERNGDNDDVDKLDYALLQLQRAVGDLPLIDGGEKRGFIAPATSAHEVQVDYGVLVLQHPLGKPMKVDLGSVIWTGTTRLRHSVNTESGSSGSPVLNAALKMVALHHAGYDWPVENYPYNQAVPMALILAHARAEGVAI